MVVTRTAQTVWRCPSELFRLGPEKQLVCDGGHARVTQKDTVGGYGSPDWSWIDLMRGDYRLSEAQSTVSSRNLAMSEHLES